MASRTKIICYILLGLIFVSTMIDGAAAEDKYSNGGLRGGAGQDGYGGGRGANPSIFCFLMAASLLNISINCSTPRLDGASSVKASPIVNTFTHSVKLPALPVNGASQKKCTQAQKNLYSGGHRNTKMVVVTATGESAEPGTNVDDILKSVQEVWEKVEDKYAVAGLGLTAIIALWGSTGLIAAIDKLPFVPSVFELVGITYTAWFTYRNLLFKPDREALLKKIQENYDQIIVSK